jgi:cyclin-dependent kinase regulatory subunit CKS1
MDIDPSRRNKKPRLLLESERERLDEFIDSIHYSARYGMNWDPAAGRSCPLMGSSYSDDKFEYRHVQLPKNMLKKIPADYFDSAKGTLKLLWEEEWRALGITQVRLGPLDLQLGALANIQTTEPGLGALRSTRARAPYSSVQVGSPPQKTYLPLHFGSSIGSPWLTVI